MAGIDFEPAHEVRELAEQIIGKHHPHLVDAKDLIGYYFRHGSSDWAGKAHKCTAFERHVTDKMLMMFVNWDAWRALKYDQRLALVDHELCHFSRKEEHWPDPETGKLKMRYAPADDPDSWQMREHDVEEFSDVIARHGLWETGIENFAATIRKVSYQMTFDDALNESSPVVPFRPVSSSAAKG